MAGRPLKLSAAGRKRLLKAVAEGNTRKAAAAFSGVGLSTLCRYLQIGRKQKAGPHRELWEAVKRAENAAEVRNVGIIRKAAAKNWTAAAWWLERRRAKDWSKKDRHEHTGPGGGAMIVNITEEVVASPHPAS